MYRDYNYTCMALLILVYTSTLGEEKEKRYLQLYSGIVLWDLSGKFVIFMK